MNTVKIEFTSRSFVIEEATLVLYNIPAAWLASITGIDMPPGAPVTDTVLRELEGLFPSQTVPRWLALLAHLRLISPLPSG
jgi:hypothetical protein